MAKYYGVSQLNHGHEYRWIFTREEIDRRSRFNGDIDEDHCVDICWPIGGSNSSATCFDPLQSDEEIRDYLVHGGYGPDSEDPELVDLAEYSSSVEADDEYYGSCTKEFLDKFGLNADELEWYDDRYNDAEEMIKYLKESGFEDFDYNNPFYGDNRDMTFGELCELYEEVCLNKEEK